MKGISPLIATVLLIAFTVAVAGIVSLWVTSFAKTATQQTENKSLTQITCAYGAISLSDVNFCGTRGEVSGRLSNKGQIALNSIRVQVIYANGSFPTFDLCLAGSSVINCSTANLTINPSYLYGFNITGLSSGFSNVNVITDCAGVTDITSTWTSNC